MRVCAFAQGSKKIEFDLKHCALPGNAIRMGFMETLHVRRHGSKLLRVKNPFLHLHWRVSKRKFRIIWLCYDSTPHYPHIVDGKIVHTIPNLRVQETKKMKFYLAWKQARQSVELEKRRTRWEKSWRQRTGEAVLFEAARPNIHSHMPLCYTYR